MTETLEELKRLRYRTLTLKSTRNDLIVQARREGHSLRSIGAAAGLSHQAVADIVKRSEVHSGG